MAVSQVQPTPARFIAESTDIVDSKIAGVGIVGAIVYLTDTKKHMIVKEDLTLVDYVIQVETIV